MLFKRGREGRREERKESNRGSERNITDQSKINSQFLNEMVRRKSVFPSLHLYWCASQGLGKETREGDGGWEAESDKKMGGRQTAPAQNWQVEM